jgi:hypothetical protein
MSIAERIRKRLAQVKQTVEDFGTVFAGELHPVPESLPPGHSDARIQEWQMVTHIRIALDHLKDTSRPDMYRVRDAIDTLEAALQQTGHHE